MDERAESALVDWRSPAPLSLVFGGVALLLSAVGLPARRATRIDPGLCVESSQRRGVRERPVG